MVHSVPDMSLRLAAVQHAASQSEERTIDMAASPQCENGFTRIANEIIEALMRTNLFRLSEPHPLGHMARDIREAEGEWETVDRYRSQ